MSNRGSSFGDDLIPQDPHVGTACVVMFRAGETTQEHKYSTMFGNAKGSVRLQRPPPSLTPSRRAFRKDIVRERTPVAMLVNSSELRAADFPLTEVRPTQLDAVVRGGRRTRGAAVRKFQGVGNSTFVLSVENDNDFRSRCE